MYTKFCLWVLCFSAAAFAEETSTLAPTAMALYGDTLYIAQAEGRQVCVVDTRTNQVLRSFKLPVRLSGLTVTPDGSTLYVTGGGAQGALYQVEAKTGRLRQQVQVGHTPGSPVIHPEEKTILVTNRFDHSVKILRLSNLETVATVPVLREPVALAVTADGRYAYVLNHLPSMRADQAYTAAKVSVIDLAKQQVVKDIPLPNGSNQLQAICLSPDGRYAYVTHILARYQLPTTQLERGWVNTNALTILDTTTQTRLDTVLLDDVGQGAANPWGVDCSADGKRLVVTLAGTHQLCVIDRPALHQRLVNAAAKKTGGSNDYQTEVSNDLAFLTGIKRRHPLPGKGPRAVRLQGSTAYTLFYFSDSVGVVDMGGHYPEKARTIALGESHPVLSELRRGEMLFNDATLCFQTWQSCASCHGCDGRVDALNWDLLNDGLGNPKNTKSLLASHQTPPVMSLGVRATAEVAVRAGVRHIQFATCSEADAQAIDAYLRALEPVASPFLEQGKPTPAALRGKPLFKQAKCDHCHSGDLYTNLQAYDVGTGLGRDQGKPFDTPTLVELWRTAPYLHDGRADTLKAMLTTFNPDDQHGKTSMLSEQEIADLEAYLLSL